MPLLTLPAGGSTVSPSATASSWSGWTYSTLKERVASWLERDDLTSRIPDFITLAESRINRWFDVREMESENAITTTVNSRTVTLPDGFREPVALWVNYTTGRKPLTFIDSSLMETQNVAGQPFFWTIDGGNLAFERICDQAYSMTLRMLGSLQLSDTQTSNYILSFYPDVYLFGALAEAGPYLKDNDLLTIYDTRFQAALTEARAKENRNRSLAPLRTEPGALQRWRTFDVYRGW